jgi:hypothetical protein
MTKLIELDYDEICDALECYIAEHYPELSPDACANVTWEMDEDGLPEKVAVAVEDE